MTGLYKYLALLVLLSATEAFSQTYPVSASVQLSPPYSIYLADYIAPGSEQLKLHLLLKDLNQPFYDAKLHMRIEGTGVVIENIPILNISPFTMEGGVPLTLSASDLSPYFNINKLSFSGITKSEFARTGRLPEGFYRICFTVVDYRRPDVALSNAGCASIWVVQNDPPRINLPLCGSEITLTDPQSIIFQWTPMHTSSPNAANTTEYEFTLAEVRPKGRNPNDAINTTVPLHRETTTFKSLFYGPSAPALIPGQQYAFRVRAVDGMGRDLFKNSGYSETCTFTFGKDVMLEPPANIIGTAETERRARISWEDQPEYTGYEVSYRKKGNDYGWFTRTTADIETLVNDLEPETTYEAQVTSMINSYRSLPSEIITFTTPGRPEFSCGEGSGTNSPVEVKPLPSARAGNIFKVGDFEMHVLKIEGRDGVFSGLGSMFIPYLRMRLNCKFSNLQVNIKQEVTYGEVVGITEGMEGFIERWEEEEEEDDEYPEGEDISAPQIFTDEETIIAGVITGIVTNMQDSTLTITKEDGTTEEYDLQSVEDDESGEKKFTDEKGNVWVVNQRGEVKRIESGDDPAPDGLMPSENMIVVQRELIKEVLEYHQTEINIWIENYGKGPLEEDLAKRLMRLPDCFSEDENQLLLVLEKVDYYLESRDELIGLLEQDSTIKERFNFLVNKLNGEQPPYLAGLTDLEWDELITMTCPYLTADLEEEEVIIEGLSRNPDFVVINEIDDTLQVGTNRLNISYTLKDTLGLKNTKLEVYRLDKDDTTMITFYTNLEQGEKIDFKDPQDNNNLGWTGKGSDGIAVNTGFYRVIITATADELYKNGYEDYEDFHVKGPEVPEFPITTEQLESIFPSTNKSRIAEVVDIINGFSNDFNINTKNKMAHFLGQVGHESNSFNSLIESQNYSAQTIYNIFLKVRRSKTGGGWTYKYCDLIKNYDCSDLANCNSNYKGPKRCSSEPVWLTDDNGEFAEYSAWTNAYNAVKTSYVNNANLFNLTYCCRLGNGSYDSGDGAKYRGRGFIQLTGKDKYDDLSDLWNEKFPQDQKDFAGKDYESVGTDVRVAMLVAMFEWKRLEENPDDSSFKDALDGEWNDTNIKTIGRNINGSGNSKANGEDDRIIKSKKAYEKL